MRLRGDIGDSGDIGNEGMPPLRPSPSPVPVRFWRHTGTDSAVFTWENVFLVPTPPGPILQPGDGGGYVRTGHGAPRRKAALERLNPPHGKTISTSNRKRRRWLTTKEWRKPQRVDDEYENTIHRRRGSLGENESPRRD